ncbi:hypothetical protein EV182_006160, partial [Spiromyces aspiralis]
MEFDQAASGDEYYEGGSNGEGGDQVVTNFVQLKQTMSQVYMRVVAILLRKAMYPSQHDLQGWDDGKVYRREVCDTFINCHYILGESMLAPIVAEVVRLMSESNTHSWQNLEVYAFGLRAVDEVVNVESATSLKPLFTPEFISGRVRAVIQDTNASVALRNGLLCLIGSYSKWWNVHPETLPLALDCITDALKQPGLAYSAALAFQRVCENCSDKLQGVVDGMTELCVQLLGFDETIFPARQQQRVFESLGGVISTLTPQEQMASIDRLTRSVMAKLHTDIAAFGQVASAGPGLIDANTVQA